MRSTVVQKQEVIRVKNFICPYENKVHELKATIRFDDECGNGYNAFSITAEKRNHNGHVIACGYMHNMIEEHIPEWEPYIKWHLCSTNGPLHYIANSLYWLGVDQQWCKGKPNDPPNWEHFKSTAIWHHAPKWINQIPPEYIKEIVVPMLNERLPSLLAELRMEVEALGLVW